MNDPDEEPSIAVGVGVGVGDVEDDGQIELDRSDVSDGKGCWRIQDPHRASWSSFLFQETRHQIVDKESKHQRFFKCVVFNRRGTFG